MGELGLYVTIKPRKRGPAAVYFELPERYRPRGWPGTIHLPLSGRTGLLDAEERLRIREDANSLRERARRELEGGAVTARPDAGRRRNWARLSNLYMDSEGYRALKPASKTSYGRFIRIVVEGLNDLEGFEPATITQSQVEAFLRYFDHTLDGKMQALTVIKEMLRLAQAEGWRSKDLHVLTTLKPPKRKKQIWEKEDMDALSGACDAAGLPVISAFIQMQWCIGQRMTDALLFKAGNEFEDGVFRFDQSKTGAGVAFPVRRLAPMLNALAAPGEYMFANPRTGRPYTDTTIANSFANVRDSLPAYAERKLLLRQLRHSAVVQMARAGGTIPQIIAVTGHSIEGAGRILKHYMPRDNVLAWQMMEKLDRMHGFSGDDSEPSALLGYRSGASGA